MLLAVGEGGRWAVQACPLHGCSCVWKPSSEPSPDKRSVFIPIPKKGNGKECSNYRTIALISHINKVMLKILQARLQQYMNRELPDVQVVQSASFNCLFIFGCVGSSLLHRLLFSSCREWGPLSSCRVQASHGGSFSCRRARPVGRTGFSTWGAWAQ